MSKNRRAVTSVATALALIPLLFPSALVAGGWPQDEGKAYIQLTYGTASSNTVYKFDGETKFPTDNGGVTVRDYPLADRGLYFYLEYGLTPDLTIIADAALKRSIITTPVESRTTEGLGDVGIAGRYRLLQKGAHVLSGRLGFTLPTGYTRDLTPPLGSGVPTVSLAAEYGVSFYPAPAYATATAGFRLRPNIYAFSSLDDDTREFEPNYANAVIADAEAGYTVAERVLIKGGARFMTTTRSDDNDFDVTHPPETERYLKVGGGAAVKVYDGFSINTDVFVTPMGRKTANSLDIFIGVAWQGNIFGAATQSAQQ